MVLTLDQFQRPQFQGYIENVPPARDYVLARFMPEDPVYDIDFAYNVVNGAYAQAASITGWDASAPLRDLGRLSEAYGSVAKIQHAHRLTEKHLLQFNNPRADAERQRAIDEVYNLTDRLSVGVDDTVEYLRAQAIYTGRLLYTDSVNDIRLDIDFRVPDANRVTATTPWTDEGATPLADIQAAIRQFRSANQRRNPVEIHMSSDTEALLLRNAEIQRQYFGDVNGSRLMTPDNLASTFAALRFPRYVINDDVVVLEDGEETPLMPTGTVALLGDGLGQVKVGPTVENNYQPGKFVLPQVAFDPPQQKIIVGKAAFPALQRPQSIVTIDTGAGA